MRIGIDTRPLARSGGGIARYAASLLEGLSRIDCENEYVLFGAGQSDRRPRLGANFVWDATTFAFKEQLDPFHLVGAAGRFDLYHATNYFPPHLDRFPSVLTVHDLSVHLFPETHPRIRRLRHCHLPRLCRRALHIMADSLSTKRDIMRLFDVPDERIDVVHLAVGSEFAPVSDPERLAALRRRYALPAEYALYLGTVEPRKNLPALLRGMALLSDRRRSIPLVIAGSGDPTYVSEIRALATREGLEAGRDVLFTEYVERDDLAGLYSAASLFVYPSLYEGFGLPPLEAMACGTPAIVSDNSSLSELYGDCAHLLVDLTPEAVADAVEQLLGDEVLRTRLIRDGLERARARTWDMVAGDTLAVYQRSLSALAKRCG